MDIQKLSQRTCVSTCTQFLATCGSDETVRVWQTMSGKMLHEFHPSKQLTTPVTSLQFSHKEILKGGAGSRYTLALGTVDGRLVQYNWNTSTVVRQWRAVDGDACVSAIQWQDKDTLIVLTNNKKLTCWNVPDCKMIRQWSVRGHSSLCLLGPSLAAVSSQSIEVLQVARGNDHSSTAVAQTQRFTGHASQITSLVSVPPKHGIIPTFLLSASQNDKFVYVWQLSQKGEEIPTGPRSPTCVLKAMQEVTSVVASHWHVAVLSVTGTLRIFPASFNRSTGQKPVPASGSLTMYSDEKQRHLLPIVRVYRLSSKEVGIAYGSGVLLRFERINLSEISSGTVKLTRSPASAGSSNRSQVQQLEAATHQGVTYACPAHMPLVKPPSSVGVKRKVGEGPDPSRLPMESLLSAIAPPLRDDTPVTSSTALALNKKSQAHLLVQGLHSNDGQLLQRVLNTANSAVVERTVAALPTAAVVPLLEHLNKCLSSWHKSPAYGLFLREVLMQHDSFLSSLPQLHVQLQPFLDYCRAVRSATDKKMRLKARLDVLMEEIKGRTARTPRSRDYAPLLLHKDESSSDDEAVIPAPLCNGSSSAPLTNGYQSHSEMEVDSGNEDEQSEQGESEDEESEDEESDDEESDDEGSEDVDQDDDDDVSDS